MSWEVNTTEIIEIDNEEGKANYLIDCVKDYFNQFNMMQSLVYINLNSLFVKLDGNTVYESLGELYARDKLSNQTEKLWDNNHSIFSVLKRFKDAKNIIIEFCFTVKQVLGEEYGTSFWKKVINNSGNNSSLIKYKAIEYYDNNDKLETVLYNGFNFEEVEYVDNKEVVNDIHSWYDGNFKIQINEIDLLDKSSKDYKELMEHAYYFEEKYNLYNDIEEPKDGKFEIIEGLGITTDKIEDLANDIETFKKISDKVNGVFNYSARFVPDDVGDNRVAAADLVVENGAIAPKYMYIY